MGRWIEIGDLVRFKADMAGPMIIGEITGRMSPDGTFQVKTPDGQQLEVPGNRLEVYSSKARLDLSAPSAPGDAASRPRADRVYPDQVEIGDEIEIPGTNGNTGVVTAAKKRTGRFGGKVFSVKDATGKVHEVTAGDRTVVQKIGEKSPPAPWEDHPNISPEAYAARPNNWVRRR